MPLSPISLKPFYAHTSADEDPWEPLFTSFGEIRLDDPTAACSGKGGEYCPHCEGLAPQHGHLNKVAYLSSRFAADMLPTGPDRECIRQWGYLAGLWHDLGKFSSEFQDYLRKASDIHEDEVLGKIDHTTAGAKHATNISPLGHIIATAIAGHHSGLLDARSTGACLEKRLRKEIASISPPHEITSLSLPDPPGFLHTAPNDYPLAFFQRMIFSSLVDADFLATEAFMNPTQASFRPDHTEDIFRRALELLEDKIASFGTPESVVAKARSSVVNDCANASGSQPGIFSLTVPTGGGKTLSSMNFALRHALKHGHTRIIYVIPFTSIIEQNAAVFRDILKPLGDDVVLEHHSNLAPEKETNTSRLATENWDAPIVVTTAVQFYESLFAAKTSRSRKIHNIANSIVILDEAQSLPVPFLSPCLKTLEQLSQNYRTTVVLCTATQPAVAKSPDFPIGFDSSSEIISNTEKLFSDLARVEVRYRGTMGDASIAEELADAQQALCIVNTRSHAREIFGLLPSSAENFHLSTLMCPEHRLVILNTVRQRLAEGLPTRLVSTQLIEAGVDIDFPLVFRSMAGLDSIAQAAGRCNREGKISTGLVHVFHSQHTSSERYFADTADIGHEILDLHTKDPLSTSAVQAYFHKYYYLQKSNWDARDILGDFVCTPQEKNLPLLFNYRTASEKFKLIETEQIPIIIPWDEKAKALIDLQLRNENIPLHRRLIRSLQRYTVQIYERQFRKNEHQFEAIRGGQFHILVCPETHYSELYGLNLTNEAANSTTLIS